MTEYRSGRHSTGKRNRSKVSKKPKKTINRSIISDERDHISKLPELKAKKFTNKQKLLKKKRYTKRPSAKKIVLIALLLFLAVNIADRAHNEWFITKEPAKLSSRSDDLAQMTFVGDIMMGRGADRKAKHEGYSTFFKNSKYLWDDSDVVVGNLESAVLRNPDNFSKNYDKDINLAMNPRGVKAIKNAGFDIVGIANNHIGDYGRKGMVNTLKVVEKNNLSSMGLGRDIVDAFNYTIYEINGIKIGIMAVTDIIPKHTGATKDKSGALTTNNEAFLSLVKEVSDKSDYSLVYMHWGEEIVQTVSERQKKLGHKIIDSGANVVVGMHPHILEPVENYKNGLIMYSLGNFVFEQEQTRTKDSIVANMRIDKNGEMAMELVPMRIKNGVPTLTRNKFYKERIYHQLGKMIPKGDKEFTEDTMIIRNFGLKFKKVEK